MEAPRKEQRKRKSTYGSPARPSAPGPPRPSEPFLHGFELQHSLLCSVATFLMTMMAGFRKPPPPHHCTHTAHRSDGTLGAHLQQGGSRRSSPFLRSVRPPQKPHGHGDSDSGCCDDDDQDGDGDDCFALTKRFFFCFAFSPRPPPRLNALTHLFFHFI